MTYPTSNQLQNASITPIGEMIVGKKVDMINVQFQYNISNKDVITNETGTAIGLTSWLNQKAQIHTGTGIGKTILTSRDSIRYIPGHYVQSEMTAIFSIPQENTKQKIGIGDDSSGFVGFGYNGTTFGIWYKTITNGEQFIALSSVNGDKLDGTGYNKFLINPQAFNIYRVKYAWFGILPLVWEVEVGGKWVEVHRFTEQNIGINPHLSNPTLPISMIIERTSGTGTDMTIQTASWRGGIIGDVATGTLIDRANIIKTLKTIPSSTNYSVISLRSKSIFQGRDNHIKTILGTVTLVTDGTKAVTFDLYKTGTITGGTWVDVDSQNSTIEYNNSSTSSVSSVSNLIGGVGLQKTDSTRINLIGDVMIPIYPGESLHIVASSTAASDVIAYIRTIEQF